MKIKERWLKDIIGILIAAFLISLIAYFWGLLPFVRGFLHCLIPIGYGAAIAFLLEPFVSRVPLSKRSARVLVCYGVLMVGALLLMLLLVPQLSRLVQRSMEQWPLRQADLQTWWKQTVFREWIDWNEIAGWLSKEGCTYLLHRGKGVLDTVNTIGMSLLFSIFFALDYDQIKQWIRMVYHPSKQMRDFYHTSFQIVYCYIRGIGLDLLFLFVTMSLLLVCFRFPDAFVYAFFIACFNLFPIIGPTFGWLVVALVSLFVYERIPWLLIGLLFVLQQVESNWVQPLIFKRVMQIRPTVTLISLLVCGYLLGWPGMIASPIIAGLVQALVRSYWYAKKSKKVGTWEEVWYNFDD